MRIEELLSDYRHFRKAAGLFLAVSLGVRLWLSAHYFGFLTGDDVEILEAGLRWVLHLGYVPWEIRNTLLPTLLVAPMGWLGASLGIASPMRLAGLATVPFALLSTLNLVLVYRLVLALRGERLAAGFAALLLGTHWLAVGYGSTVYPRTAATTCILLAALWSAKSPPSAARLLGAGAFVALAFSFRYSEMIFLPPLLLLAARAGSPATRLRRAAAVGAGFAAGALLFVGIADQLEWGAPFASLRAFFDYTVVEGRASALVAHQPGAWYLGTVLRWLSPAVIGGLWFFRRRRVPWALAAFVVLPLLALSVVPHKELRYLQGVLPFLCALGGIGLAGLWRDGRRSGVVTLCALSLAWSAVQLRFLEKKSMAAVAAARYLTETRPAGSALAVQQPWAYGDRLILPVSFRVRELPMDLEHDGLGHDFSGVAIVALYADRLTPSVAQALAAAGLCAERQFAWGRSRAVSIYSACPAE
ncbi:MAG: hypothetical protein ABI689_10665 [Thermoanaerobaculia bacterium]